MGLFLLGTLIAAVVLGGWTGAVVWGALMLAWLGLGKAAGY